MMTNFKLCHLMMLSHSKMKLLTCPQLQWGHYALMVAVCPSSVHDLMSRTEGHRKLRIGGKKARDTRDPRPHLEVKGQRSRSPRGLTPGPKSSHIFRMGSPIRTSNLVGYTDGGWPASPTCAVNSKLKALGGCSGHHLQGQGHTVAAQLQAAQCCYYTYTVFREKHPLCFLLKTSANVDRFSKFFHLQTQQWLGNAWSLRIP